MNPAADEKMNIVVAGHVDHGKSTVIGRLLADTDSLPKGKLEQIQELCRRTSRPFEYAFLLDALKDEQAQGITIDSARIFFKSAKRHYLILDAPGHIEFLRNMVTGASHAEAALLVIDAAEGVRENSRRHGYMLSMLGVHQIAVLINKMDLAGWSRDTFEKIADEYKRFLQEIGLSASFIPVSGMAGDNIARRSERMTWYEGPTVLETLDAFIKEPLPVDKPFRMPVQDVYKFTRAGDQRRIVVGTVETGAVRPGDELIFYPSGKKSRVKTLERFGSPPPQAYEAGQAASFTLEEQIYLTRGQIAARAGEPAPEVGRRFQVHLFWMGKEPLRTDKDYLIKVGTAKQPMRVEKILSVMDASDLRVKTEQDFVGYHDVADCILQTARAVAFDLSDRFPTLSRFVIVDEYEIRGGGLIRKVLPDAEEPLRQRVMQRNLKWAMSTLSREQRWERYSQKASLVLITGRKNVGKKTLARALERKLFAEGKLVYFMGIANVLYGVDADIKTPGPDTSHRPEHLRRLGEVANLMLDAGLILIVTAIGLTQSDLEIIRTAVDSDLVEVVWLGPDMTDIQADLQIENPDNPDEAAGQIKRLLQQKGIIFSV
ncbi:MAG TPA: GTP-binding protein [Anaerohalosphaeraceae bacterium]|nr:GTP-binding protein [Anaerohalosphaeraceae bacterium]HOL90012.1 GTP-binding protein [Anaerohalosphaeraceae bacterium]HPP57341.1 GTP-binding protein [Anaerohalosphaeraceae bacterium]